MVVLITIAKEKQKGNNEITMQAIILAAGKGTRMRPLTNTVPKQLVTLRGKPLLYYTFAALPKEITEVILVIGYLGAHIQRLCGTSYQGRKIHYVMQKQALGTAKALFLCKPFIIKNESFLVMYADDIYKKEDIARLLDYPSAMLVKEVENPRAFGIVTCDANNCITELIEKPAEPVSNLANIGVYVLDGRIFQYEPRQHANGEYYLTDSIAQLAKDHPIVAVPASFWIPIASPEDIANAESLLAS